MCLPTVLLDIFYFFFSPFFSSLFSSCFLTSAADSFERTVDTIDRRALEQAGPAGAVEVRDGVRLYVLADRYLSPECLARRKFLQGQETAPGGSSSGSSQAVSILLPFFVASQRSHFSHCPLLVARFHFPNQEQTFHRSLIRSLAPFALPLKFFFKI